MRMIDAFAGIGTASLAADIVWGRENNEHQFIEINPYGQTILRKHWPKAKIHGDIRTYKADGPCDILWGSFPCQAVSTAGKRKASQDDRWLWPETIRVVREARPKYFIGENVRGLLSAESGVLFENLCLDLEREGYAVAPFVLPAAGVGAPHRRDRVWIVCKRIADDTTSDRFNNRKHITGIDEEEVDALQRVREPFGTIGKTITFSDTPGDRRTGGGSGAEAEEGHAERPEPAGVVEGGFERPDSDAPHPHGLRPQVEGSELEAGGDRPDGEDAPHLPGEGLEGGAGEVRQGGREGLAGGDSDA